MSLPLHLPESTFAIVSIPRARYGEALAFLADVEGFVAIMRDNEEVSIVLAEEAWHSIAASHTELRVVARVAPGWRLIQFDTVLDFSLVGFLAQVSRLLADAGISVFTISTYRTDAILVQESKYPLAVSIIESNKIGTMGEKES